MERMEAGNIGWIQCSSPVETEGNDELGQGPGKEEGSRKCVFCLPVRYVRKPCHKQCGGSECGLWSQVIGI